MCNLIIHSFALHLCFNTWWNFKNSMFDRSKVSRSIEIFNKSILKFLDDSIDSRFLFDQLKGTFDRSKGIFDWSKNWRNSSQSFWMTQSILDSYSIDLKEHSINRREFLICQNSWNWIFSDFSSNHFWRFTWTKHSSLIVSEWDCDQNWISLMW